MYETNQFLVSKVLHPMPGVQSQTKAVDLSQCDEANPKSLDVALSRKAPGETNVFWMQYYMNILINGVVYIYIYNIYNVIGKYRIVYLMNSLWIIKLQNSRIYNHSEKVMKSLCRSFCSPTSAAPQVVPLLITLINSGRHGHRIFISSSNNKS